MFKLGLNVLTKTIHTICCVNIQTVPPLRSASWPFPYKPLIGAISHPEASPLTGRNARASEQLPGSKLSLAEAVLLASRRALQGPPVPRHRTVPLLQEGAAAGTDLEEAEGERDTRAEALSLRIVPSGLLNDRFSSLPPHVRSSGQLKTTTEVIL